MIIWLSDYRQIILILFELNTYKTYRILYEENPMDALVLY